MPQSVRCWISQACFEATIVSALALTVTLGACVTEPSSPVRATPAAVANAIIEYEVNGEAGTLTFKAASLGSQSPSGGEPASGITRAIYGTQGSTVTLSATTSSIDSTSTPGTRTYSFDVGVRNLLSHAVGAVQGATVPSDTTGIYIFFESPLAVTSPLPCSGCSVAAINTQGTMSFDSPSQSYFFYPERLAPFGSAGDTTRNRVTWKYRTVGNVRGFRGTLLLSTAFPPPSETRWKVDFEGDSLPDTQSEPKWKFNPSGNNSGSESASGGTLTLTTKSSHAMRFDRYDSLATTAKAYIAARARVVSNNSTSPILGLRIYDGARFCAVGVGNGQAGLIDVNANYLSGTTFSLTTTSFHAYELSKFGIDSVVLYVDGARRAKIAYGTCSTSTQQARMQWGSFSTNPANTTEWDYVLYEIGAAGP
jgi:hypothetical protein